VGGHQPSSQGGSTTEDWRNSAVSTTQTNFWVVYNTEGSGDWSFALIYGIENGWNRSGKLLEKDVQSWQIYIQTKNGRMKSLVVKQSS
jgi:hypothetical protein